MSGCAVAADGSLLSPSKINFYNDPDDVNPISGPSFSAATAPASTKTLSATRLDNYFAPQQPVVEAAGLRRTNRLPKPSARVRDAADALGDSTTSGKRKATNTFHRRVVRKITPNSDDSDEENSDSGPNSSPMRSSAMSLKTTDDTEKATDIDGTDTDEVRAAYDQTREMGDEDRKVSLIILMTCYTY
jgi:hypothetical protein